MIDNLHYRKRTRTKHSKSRDCVYEKRKSANYTNAVPMHPGNIRICNSNSPFSSPQIRRVQSQYMANSDYAYAQYMHYHHTQHQQQQQHSAHAVTPPTSFHYNAHSLPCSNLNYQAQKVHTPNHGVNDVHFCRQRFNTQPSQMLHQTYSNELTRNQRAQTLKTSSFLPQNGNKNGANLSFYAYNHDNGDMIRLSLDSLTSAITSNYSPQTTPKQTTPKIQI